MAKKALKNKQERQGKFKVREYTRCRRCGRARAVYRRFLLCRICFRELAHAGELPGGDEGVMVKLATNVNDPVGDLLTRIRNANLAYKDDLVVPASKMNGRSCRSWRPRATWRASPRRARGSSASTA